MKTRREAKAPDAAPPYGLWSRDDLLLLLRAWRDVLPSPPKRRESTVKSSMHVLYERLAVRFHTLAKKDRKHSSSAHRSPTSITDKVRKLVWSYRFICDFNDEARSTRVRLWFSLSLNSRKERVTDVVHVGVISTLIMVDREIFAELHRITESGAYKRDETMKVNRTKPRVRMAVPDKDSESDNHKVLQAEESYMGGPWEEEEQDRLLCAWQDVVEDAESRQKPLQSVKALNQRVYERYTELCEDADSSFRTKRSVVWKRCVMRRSFEFISRFNKAKRNKAANWFALSQTEKNKLVAADPFHSNRGFMYFDEDSFRMMEGLVKRSVKISRDAADPTTVDEDFTWSRDEVILLLHAWHEIADDVTFMAGISKEEVDTLIYEKFCSLCEGASFQDVLRQIRYLVLMHKHIADYNSMAETESQDNNEGMERKSWFRLRESKRKSEILRITKTADNQTSRYYVAMDKEIFGMVDKIRQIQNEPIDFIEPASSNAMQTHSPSHHSADSLTSSFSDTMISEDIPSSKLVQMPDASDYMMGDDGMSIHNDDSDDDSGSSSSERESIIDSDTGCTVWTARVPRKSSSRSIPFIPVSPEKSEAFSSPAKSVFGNDSGPRSEDKTSPADSLKRGSRAQKKRRLDSDVLNVINILEEKARFLSMLATQMRAEIKEERELREAMYKRDREERWRFLEEMQRDRAERKQMIEQFKRDRDTTRR
ncbi:hypothetical protein FI667_g16831, partial [Globisporangium splendens]